MIKNDKILFLLENSALKFDGSGVGRRSKRISKPVSIKRNFITSIMSYGKIPPNVLSTAERCIRHLIIYSRLHSIFDYIQQATVHI